VIPSTFLDAETFETHSRVITTVTSFVLSRIALGFTQCIFILDRWKYSIWRLKTEYTLWFLKFFADIGI